MSEFLDFAQEFAAFADGYCRCAERRLAGALRRSAPAYAAGARTASDAVASALAQRYASADADGKAHLDRMIGDTGARLALGAALAALADGEVIGSRAAMAAILNLHTESARLLQRLAAVEPGSPLGELFAWLERLLAAVPNLLLAPEEGPAPAPRPAKRPSKRK